MKSVGISGASGFVGSELRVFLQKNGYDVIEISRDDLNNEKRLISKIEKSDIIINLAGANIISRWSKKYKKVLRQSRIDTTNRVVNAIKNAKKRPKLFISTSAIGIYNNKISHDEQSFEYADDFLANLCKDWEEAAFKAKDLSVRVCIFRFGIVLGNGGALKKMLPPFRFGLGGKIGNGKQRVCFIHIKDLLSSYKFVIDNETMQGVFNLIAPTCTTNEGLTNVIGKTLKRVTFFTIPEVVLRVIFGEGAKVLTDGQLVKPKRLLESGFKFEFENIEKAIEDLLR